ncbi:hypothetical protein GCM10009775_20800 [Microbacterium aoyamense]|uniref:Uncharacterized protein n=1 Tax=Microbacterium aoyamense TaxID=344166 RepID=A0ABN2PRE3_9MICO|nr:hypothetical protein [Microbacterium aoyamense]
MGITAVAAHRVDATTTERLGLLGIEVEQRDGDASLAGALAYGALIGIAERGTDAAADLLAAADTLSATGGGPLAVVVFPATLPLQPGPVAVLSPAGAVSAYELYIAAAVAAASGRRVEHLNGRGTLASATHSGIASRVLARAAAPAWHELTFARPERSLHELVTRPAAIVVAVPPGSTEAAGVIAGHPDADVFVVFDRAHVQHGATVADQAAAMVELAFGLGVPTAPEVDAERPRDAAPVEAPDPLPDLAAIRTSDVVHVRLTATTLELTNRTRQRLRVRVDLGSEREPGDVRAAFETTLEPGSARTEDTESVAGISDLERPVAVMRHWSHTSEEVYEGGEQRMLALHVAVLDGDGDVRAEHSYRPGNGLDFLVTARDLTALLGRPVARSILPEPAVTSTGETPRGELLSALAAALDVGAGVLAMRAANG